MGLRSKKTAGYRKYRIRQDRLPNELNDYFKRLPKEITNLVTSEHGTFTFRLVGFTDEGVLENDSTRLAFLVDVRDLHAWWECIDHENVGNKS